MWLVRLIMRDTAALGACMHALQRRTFVDHDRGDLQFVDVGTDIVLGVGDSRQQHFLDQLRGLLVAESEQVGRATDSQATNLVSDQSHLLRRNARAAQYGFGFHRASPCLLLGFGGFLVAGVALERARHARTRRACGRPCFR